MGYFPPFMLARSLHRMLSKPILIGGISMFMGYLYSILIRQKKVNDQDLTKFLRKKQRKMLRFWMR